MQECQSLGSITFLTGETHVIQLPSDRAYVRASVTGVRPQTWFHRAERALDPPSNNFLDKHFHKTCL